jgi:hypothetical protein
VAAHSDSAPLFLVFIGFSGMTCVPFKPWFFWGQPLVIHLNPVCVEEALITSLSDLIPGFLYSAAHTKDPSSYCLPVQFEGRVYCNSCR